MPHRATHYGKTAFKKLKILSFLAPFISKIKTVHIFNFLSAKYSGKVLLFFKIWHIRVNYCWNYGPSNLLFRGFLGFFFCYRLVHSKNRRTKIAENSTIIGKSFKFLDLPTTQWRLFNFFAKLKVNHVLMAKFSKLCKHQTFGLTL